MQVDPDRVVLDLAVAAELQLGRRAGWRVGARRRLVAGAAACRPPAPAGSAAPRRRLGARRRGRRSRSAQARSAPPREASGERTSRDPSRARSLAARRSRRRPCAAGAASCAGELVVVGDDAASSCRSSRLSSKNSSCISRPVLVSRLPVGSSASSRRGRSTSARASATRCCSPPDSSPGRWVRRSARPSRDQHRRRRARARSARGSRWISPGIITFSSAVNSGSRWWNWKTKPISRLRNVGQPRRRSSWSRSTPSNMIVPDGGQVQRAEDVQQRRLADPRGARPPTPSRPGWSSKSMPRSTSRRAAAVLRTPWSALGR